MKAIWTLLTLLFGVATLAAIANGLQSLKNAGTSGAHNSYRVTAGILDGALQLLFIGLLALATRACYRRASRDKKSAAPDVDADRRPWER